MKRIALAVVVAVVGLSGCAIVPAGPYHHGRGAVVVGPAVVAQPPVIVVRPDPYERRGWYGRPWRRGY